MKKLIVGAIMLAVLAVSVTVSPSFVKAGETSVTTNDVSGVAEFDAATMRKIVRALSANDGLQRTLPPICDSFGYTWHLTVSGTRNGGNITGTADICGTWPVTGTYSGLSFDMTADITGNGCFCNSFHQFVGTVNKQTKTASGTAYASGGCTGSAPCTAGLCE